MESLKTALVANLGTTPEPILKALEVAVGDGNLILFLAYGKKIQDQEKPPVIMAEQINERAQQLDMTCLMYELDTPEEFQGAFEFYQRLMEAVGKNQPGRVVIDVTGGTKVMSAALVHAALTQKWGAEVIFEYVGGSRGPTGRVMEMELMRDDGIVTKERMKLVLEAIRQQEFARAVILAEYLPGHGNAGFLKSSVGVLWSWDNFHYDDTLKSLEAVATQAQTLIGDEQLGMLADTVLRLNKISSGIGSSLIILSQLKISGSTAMDQKLFEGWINILGDAIANARRRKNSDPVDCVLRCYRAAEIATQIAVLKLGVNVWRPNWDNLSKEKLEAYCNILHQAEPPFQVSLDAGIKLIETLTSPLPDIINQEIKKMETARNHSYLEHGYDKASSHTAQSLLAKIEKIIPALLVKVGIHDNVFEIADKLRIEA